MESNRVPTGFLQSAIEKSVEVALNLIDSSVALTSDKKQERLGPFFVRDVHDHKIHLKLSKSISKTITTDADGRFHEKIVVDSLDGLDIRGSAVTYLASDNANDQQVSQGTIYLMRSSERGGCSIISDIDDTIKISDVPNKQRLMTNTFKKDFVPVPGMSELYRAWQSAHHCSVHYVSAMPSQLYYVTQKFLRKEQFPGGSFRTSSSAREMRRGERSPFEDMRHLKLVSTEKSLLLLKLSEFIQHEGSRKHKLNVIEDILQHAPIGRRFVMVGDSGELDPEVSVGEEQPLDGRTCGLDLWSDRSSSRRSNPDDIHTSSERRSKHRRAIPKGVRRRACRQVEVVHRCERTAEKAVRRLTGSHCRQKCLRTSVHCLLDTSTDTSFERNSTELRLIFIILNQRRTECVSLRAREHSTLSPFEARLLYE